jgi:hypothetical protein
MADSVSACVVINALNEAASIVRQFDALRAQEGDVRFDVLVCDNGSSDGTPEVVRDYARRYPSFGLSLCTEERKGVALALRRGMNVAARRGYPYLIAVHADSIVDERFVAELLEGMQPTNADLGVADCYYSAAHFAARPRLWEIIDVTMQARAALNRLLGGFPEGKGFAVRRELYERVGGIEILYQMKGGTFVPHPSDDLDFGVRAVANDAKVAFCERSRVEIDPRRVDEQLDEMIAGRAYGRGGVFDMPDVRPDAAPELRDVAGEEEESLWGYSLKDVVIRGLLLPLLLDTSHFHRTEVHDFLGETLAVDLARRVREIRDETRLIDFTPIHSYKSPCYRLYFEFVERICARFAERLHARFGDVPPLPPPLAAVAAAGDEDEWRTFVRYYCDDRESGEAHNYFGTGVF